MSIAHSFMSILIHRAGFMSIARYEFYDNIGSMYELCSEMQKAASMASALVLFFSTNCANFLPVYAPNWLNLNAVLC